MLELLVLISGVVILWKFSKSTTALAQGAETKTQVWAEEIISDAVIERSENYKAFKDKLGDNELISHEKYMQEMLGKK